MRIAVLKGLHIRTCVCAPVKPGFIVTKNLVIAVYLSCIYSSSKGASGKTHQIIQGGHFWADQRIPQLNLDENQEDTVKKEHGDPEVQPEKKDMTQSKQEELEPEIPDNTPTEPLKIVHLDLKGAAPKVKYLKEVGIRASKLHCVSKVPVSIVSFLKFPFMFFNRYSLYCHRWVLTGYCWNMRICFPMRGNSPFSNQALRTGD